MMHSLELTPARVMRHRPAPFFLTPTLRSSAVPLPRRWARAKAWSRARATAPLDVERIKLMLRAERANRG